MPYVFLGHMLTILCVTEINTQFCHLSSYQNDLFQKDFVWKKPVSSQKQPSLDFAALSILLLEINN